jgi:GDP-mannose 6-dehydrogenase
LPVLDAILHSNKLHIEYALQLVAQTEKKKVGILGLAFKAGTDDLRESPIVALIETLIGKGYQVQIYDKNVSYSMLRGSNRKYIEDKIPHIASLLCKNLEDIVEMAEVIIIGNRNAEFVNIFSEADRSQVIIDLVRISEECNTEAVYQGICW